MRSLSQLDGKTHTSLSKQIITYALLATILIVAQVALAFIPNIELVSLLVIVYTRILGFKAMYPVAAFIGVEGLIYGFGLWWINYLYIWAVLVFVTMIFRKTESAALWAIISGIFGLLYGALCAIPYIFIGGLPSAFAYWLSGIPFDLAHGFGNFVAAILLITPVNNMMQRQMKDFIT